MFRLMAFCAAVLPAFGADEWPEFRGPTGQGISAARNVPAEWSATSGFRWKVPVPGKGWSSPVVSGGKIFLTSATEEGSGGIALRALCFNAADGKLIWNREVFRPSEGETRAAHRKNSLASPTPVAREGKVFVHFGHMGTAALDFAGSILWTNSSLKYSPVHGNGGSPILHRDLLIFNCDAATEPFIVALEAKTGAERWRTVRETTARNKFSFSTPLIIEADRGEELVSPGSGMVGGYHPENGKELWRSRYGEGFSVIVRPVYAHGMIFVSSGYERPGVNAVRVSGATGDVTGTHVAWTLSRGAPNTPSMIALGDELYFVSDSGIATCVDARTGKQHWSERLGGDFSASPIAAEGKLYFINEAGVASVLKAGKAFEAPRKNDLGERTLASPAALDGALIIRTDERLWRIGR